MSVHILYVERSALWLYSVEREADLGSISWQLLHDLCADWEIVTIAWMSVYQHARVYAASRNCQVVIITSQSLSIGTGKRETISILRSISCWDSRSHLRRQHIHIHICCVQHPNPITTSHLFPPKLILSTLRQSCRLCLHLSLGSGQRLGCLCTQRRKRCNQSVPVRHLQAGDRLCSKLCRCRWTLVLLQGPPRQSKQGLYRRCTCRLGG